MREGVPKAKSDFRKSPSTVETLTGDCEGRLGAEDIKAYRSPKVPRNASTTEGWVQTMQ